MRELTGKRGELADMLFELEAIKFGAFRLKLHDRDPTAPLSPIYLNLRTADHPANPGPLTPETMTLIGDLFQETIGQADLDFDRFTGIPDAGEPFADQLERVMPSWEWSPTRLRLKKVVLPEAKRRISDSIEGDFQQDDVVLVVDDLITQADSKLEAIRALQNQGLQVADVLVLVDRLQGGAEQLEAAGYRLISVFDLEELLSHYVQRELISSSKANQVRFYIENNRR